MGVLIVEGDLGRGLLLRRALLEQVYSIVLTQHGADAAWPLLERDFGAVISPQVGYVGDRQKRVARQWASAVVVVNVNSLRMKMRPFARNSLRTVRGAGYRITDDRPQ